MSKSMATFHIHEDLENRPNAFKKKKFCVTEKSEVAGKKNISENRGILQPVNNGVKIHEEKRVKFEAEKHDVASHKIELKTEIIVKTEKIEEFLDIENNQVQLPTSIAKEIERESFPRELLYNVEYRKDIWQYLIEFEKSCPQPKPNYMLKQADLSWNTRSILVDWLASVTDEYKFCDQTFHLCVSFLDRFLSQIAVVRSKFQLVGAAAMFVAGKMEEIYPINAEEWAYLTGDAFTKRQVLKMEQLIIKVLRFRLQPPTIYSFIQHFCAEQALDPKTVHLALYISELVLLEGNEYLNHTPSELAAAAIAFARLTLSKRQPWPRKLKEASGFTLRQLSPVVQRQQRTFRDSPLKEQQAIQTKYKSEKYSRVALLNPRALKLDDLEDEE